MTHRFVRLGGIALLSLLAFGWEVFATFPQPAEAANPAVLQAVRDRINKDGNARVLVELRLPSGDAVPEGALPNAAAVNVQRQEIGAARGRVLARLRSTTHRVQHQYQTIPFLALEIGADALLALETSVFDVKQVVEDGLRYPTLTESVPYIEADQVWAQGIDGTGTVIAIIDTGVDSGHPFLQGKVVEEACYSSIVKRRSKSLCPNGQSTQTGPGSAIPCSALFGCEHGTHVAGIAAGDGALAGEAFSGVAPSAHLMAVQVFARFDRAADCGGFPPCIAAWDSDVIAALERVYTVSTQHNIVAVNMSLGGGLFTSPCDTQPYKPAIDLLRSVGIASVVAAGNDGSSTALNAPACISSAVSVGSTATDDSVSWFSNVTPFLSLLAPGDFVLSSVPGGDYTYFSGTSMATPHVAGAWALLRQAAPGATVNQILGVLRQTGVPVTDTRVPGGATIPRIRMLQAFATLFPDVPFIGSVNPGVGGQTETLDVLIGGANLQAGATVGFGPDIAVNLVTVDSPSQLTANITIPAAAALGYRDVTVTNPGGQSATRTGAFRVVPPPPALGLSYAGTLRDRVGQGNLVFAPDGQLDGTFALTLGSGSGSRTVVELYLQRSDGYGVYDTVPATGYWALGTARTLDTALLNATGPVNFLMTEGETIYLFAADAAPTPFVAGQTFTVIMRLADGSTGTATTTIMAPPAITDVAPAQGTVGGTLSVTVSGASFVNGMTVNFGAGIAVNSVTVNSLSQLTANITIAAGAALGYRDVTVTNPAGQSATRFSGFRVVPPAPVVGLSYAGTLRDWVGPANTAFAPDQQLDGTFALTLGSGSGSRTVVELYLQRSDGYGIYDTVPATDYWALGAARTLDTGWLNGPTGPVNFLMTEGETIYLFAANAAPSPFVTGQTFSVTVRFDDGSFATTSTTIGPITGPTLALAYSGLLRDRVGQGNTAFAPDQQLDGTFALTLASGSGSRTVVELYLQRSDGYGIYDTVPATGYWALGAARTLDTGWLNGPTGPVNFLMTEGETIYLFAANAAPSPFVTGQTFSVTVRFDDGSLATTSTTIGVVPPPSLSLSYAGTLRDRVGQGNTAFAPDQQLDGTFALTLASGSGSRTVVELYLQRSDGYGVYDTVPATGYWALGAARTLDTGWLNGPTGPVSFLMAEGETIYLFAADAAPSPFKKGQTFSVTVRFDDGSFATTSTTIGP